MNKYIIVDTKTKTALYAHSGITMMFSTYDMAEEVASLFFIEKTSYLIFQITLPI